MSEMPPEQPGGGMMSQKILGMPAPLFVVIVGVVAYVLFFRNSAGGASSSGGGGTSTTGDVTLTPGTTTVNVSAPVKAVKGVALGPGKRPVHQTPNPQPRPKVKPKTKKTAVPVAHKGKPAPTVTVARWTAKNTPWNSTLSGISSHTHTSIAELLKLNPQIKDPNKIFAGEKIRY